MGDTCCMAKDTSSEIQYYLDDKGHFVIDNYNQSKPFSNFFPGIAGLWGIPMWAFYVNRGQCLASFGIESKDKSIMEFQPANKSYRYSSLSGFRTFLKVTKGGTVHYWEPFQNGLKGTEFKSQTKMIMAAHDLKLEENNEDLGLTITVNYFTLPQESYAGLVRRVTIINHNKSDVSVELVDGLPVITPYGLGDWLNKHLSRTVEAWVKVRNLDNKAPYYQLEVEVDDSPEVRHIKEGNFFFSFNPNKKGLLKPIVESVSVFGQATDFISPERFLNLDNFVVKNQQTSNRSPSAMTHTKLKIASKATEGIVSVFGSTHTQENLDIIVDQVQQPNFIDVKAEENKNIIDGIKNYTYMHSSSDTLNKYAGSTFLDNILRGGLPVSLKTRNGHVGFNVYSRKHGDLERDYNFFVVAPSYYSQGNGNYRDVNQNRRNDVWFNGHIKSSHLIGFMNLIQADGYNPLVVKGVSFIPNSLDMIKEVINAYVVGQDNQDKILEKLSSPFLPGDVLKYVEHNCIKLNIEEKEFLGFVLEVCTKREEADHGEGFWSDHWTYNLDLIESYLALYPEDLEKLLLNTKEFTFYFNSHYVLPRRERYILTDRGVRQYASVKDGKTDIKPEGYGDCLKDEEGKVFYTNLMNKLLCLIVCKVATLDPSGIGIEMEADKPNWYDSLNGLPGLLGSSISETFEVKRYAKYLLEAIKNVGIEKYKQIVIYDELWVFLKQLKMIFMANDDDFHYWDKANTVKEEYRESIRKGIKGEYVYCDTEEVCNFLELVIAKTMVSEKKACNQQGFLPTYFYHDVIDYEVIGKGEEKEETFVMPKTFKRHDLPLFLEGYVHALRSEKSQTKAKNLYKSVRKSDLYDSKLGMYKVNTNLSSESEEIGRTRIFPRSWLENESVWLHMEYKYMLEVLRNGLYDEFYADFKNVFIPFLNPKTYGRSILENSSFIVSSAHEDKNLHGQGFVARLSGSTAEFIHIWLYMNIGQRPFQFTQGGDLSLRFSPALAGWLFTKTAKTFSFFNRSQELQEITLPKNSYAFNFLNGTLVVYHNSRRINTYDKSAKVKEIHLSYTGQDKVIIIKSQRISNDDAYAVRSDKVDRIDIYWQ